jgi:nucleoside-diphosphate-sugar epimerase
VATARRANLKETFALLKKITGFQGDVKFGPERAGDVKHSLADISRTEKYLGYKPLVHFEDGLKKTVDWYRTQMPAATRQSSAVSS